MFTLPANRGCSRHVLLFKKFVVKIPRISAWFENKPSLARFKLNLYLNRREITLCKKHAGEPGIPKLYFGGLFGLLVIMKRYQSFTDTTEYTDKFAQLVKDSNLPFEFWENDMCIANFGFDYDGSIVKIDLG